MSILIIYQIKNTIRRNKNDVDIHVHIIYIKEYNCCLKLDFAEYTFHIARFKVA